jgi:drug/metabolite transporter (DMT)-like permease
MSIFKPFIREAVQIAMSEFMEKHWTRFLAALVIVFVGVAWLIGKPDVTVTTFLDASMIGLGANVLRSGTHAVAGALSKGNHQEVKP